MNILYKSSSERGDLWADLLAKLAPDASFRQWPDIGDPASINYLVARLPRLCAGRDILSHKATRQRGVSATTLWVMLFPTAFVVGFSFSTLQN
ncbi:hypothetical protein [Erwinia billingiae]|jgi:hypothetical protein|uniref:hypothetical protein n=1 Tax=Erwinia billingiae TaxID=182337 RepID=UPI00069D4041|nr:hypothetical protein [Erwinia billingiae]